MSAMSAVNRIVGASRQQFARLESVTNRTYSRIERAAMAARRQQELLNGSVSKSSSIFSKLAMLTGGAISIGGAAGMGKAMIDEAASMETYRMTLETVLKSADKAREKLAWASQFANVTPFETSEVVEGTVKLTNYGMVAEKVLPRIGDMAAVMGKRLDQGVEAVADAQNGELERLKEFGITKNMIVAKAAEMFKGFSVVNTKGQITDLKKFNEALMGLMNDKFAGGMEKNSRTFKGLWSTITGVTKSGMAQIAGITSTGDIVSGSLFDLAKQKAQQFGDALTRMQADGTFERWTKVVADNTSKFIGILSTGYKVVKDHWGLIKAIGIAYGSYWVAVRLAWMWTVAMNATLAATGAWRTVITLISMATTGYGLQTTAIYAWDLAMGSAAVTAGILTAAVAAIAWSGYTLYKRWDDVKVIFDSAGESMSTLWDLMLSNPISKFLLSDMNPLFAMLRGVNGTIQKMLDIYNTVTGSNIKLTYEAGGAADMIINNRTSKESFAAGQSAKLQLENLKQLNPKLLNINIPVNGYVDPALTAKLDQKVKEGIKEYQRKQGMQSGEDQTSRNYNSKFDKMNVGGR